MKTESNALKEIHEIRENIYEETKNMSPEERVKHTHYEAQKLIEQYNMKVNYEKKLL